MPRKIGYRLGLVIIAVASAAVGIGAAMATPRTASPYAKLAVFARVLSHIERSYVDKVDEDGLVYGAIKGMVRTLDPHSSFLTPDEYRALNDDTVGRFGGVGLEVGVHGDVLTVIAPMAGSPAQKAGILPGDQIVAIEGRSARSLGIEDAVRLMRGEAGTKVTATFRRAGRAAPFDVTMTREVIKVESVKAELLAPGYPWIRVLAFQDGTTADLEDAVERLTAEGGGLEGLVLDLRGNPGGLLEEAVRTADLFLDRGVIVTTRGRGGEVLQTFEAKSRGTLDAVPVVALVDQSSASAAEIVAGALQDQGRALLVGARTFGKGSVQNLIDLEDGSGLKLTVALYFTPSGRSIQAEGVQPDVIVESRKAPPAEQPDAGLGLYYGGEADLPGHLAPDKARAAAEEAPAIADFQLRVAFQVLKGLTTPAAKKLGGKKP
ncbi:MAG: S41 family peptidase [Deltaproteobacteria bacterium]|nr:S41 family peptidase [Deltaproteobacteria bacterium]